MKYTWLSGHSTDYITPGPCAIVNQSPSCVIFRESSVKSTLAVRVCNLHDSALLAFLHITSLSVTGVEQAANHLDHAVPSAAVVTVVSLAQSNS